MISFKIAIEFTQYSSTANNQLVQKNQVSSEIVDKKTYQINSVGRLRRYLPCAVKIKVQSETQSLSRLYGR